MTTEERSHLLRQLMTQAGISSYRALAQKAGISQWQVMQVRRGNLGQMRLAPLQALSQALQLPLADFIAQFSSTAETAQPLRHQTLETDTSARQDSQRLQVLEQEYARLQSQIARQRGELNAQFRRESLQKLESWLTYWPSATHAVEQQQTQIAPENLIRLVRPVEQLMRDWGVRPIGQVGEVVAFDPQQHQLVQGNAQPQASVRVKAVGYWLDDKLLFRAKCVVL